MSALMRRPIVWAPTLSERHARDLDAALRAWEDGLRAAAPATCLGVPGFVAPHEIRNADLCCGDFDHDGYCLACCEDPRALRNY